MDIKNNLHKQEICSIYKPSLRNKQPKKYLQFLPMFPCQFFDHCQTKVKSIHGFVLYCVNICQREVIMLSFAHRSQSIGRQHFLSHPIRVQPGTCTQKWIVISFSLIYLTLCFCFLWVFTLALLNLLINIASMLSCFIASINTVMMFKETFLKHWSFFLKYKTITIKHLINVSECPKNRFTKQQS